MKKMKKTFENKLSKDKFIQITDSRISLLKSNNIYDIVGLLNSIFVNSKFSQLIDENYNYDKEMTQEKKRLHIYHSVYSFSNEIFPFEIELNDNYCILNINAALPYLQNDNETVLILLKITLSFNFSNSGEKWIQTNNSSFSGNKKIKLYKPKNVKIVDVKFEITYGDEKNGNFYHNRLIGISSDILEKPYAACYKTALHRKNLLLSKKYTLFQSMNYCRY